MTVVLSLYDDGKDDESKANRQDYADVVQQSDDQGECVASADNYHGDSQGDQCHSRQPKEKPLHSVTFLLGGVRFVH